MPMILKCSVAPTGYPMVVMWYRYQTKSEYIHRLVMLAFKGPPNAGENNVAHLDNNKTNNLISNLKWVTVSENSRHMLVHKTARLGEFHHSSKLTWSEIREIRRLFKNGMASKASLARKFGVTQGNIHAIVTYKTWRSGSQLREITKDLIDVRLV